MYKKIILCFLSSCCLLYNTNAQQTSNAKGQLVGEYLGFINPCTDNVDLDPMLSGKISENESDNELIKEEIKTAKMQEKLAYIDASNSANKKTRGNHDPTYVTGIKANITQGTPSDNSVAVNKNGIAISVVNSNIKYYNVSGPTFVSTYTKNLSSFFAALTFGSILSTNMCDPKVLYDLHKDRFILFAQTCDGDPASSQILVAFSKTNDPANGWFLYGYSMPNQSAVIGTNKWFDYPKIAVSNRDVFITGNLFDGAIPSSQFAESVIFQLNKNQGYAGITTSAPAGLIWNNLDNSPFTLVPFRYEFLYDFKSKMVFASTIRPSQFSGPSSMINIYEISDSTNASPQPTITFSQVALPAAYSYAADAFQSGSSIRLDVGDLRAQDGFQVNGVMHLVFHCDVGSGFAGVNYSRFKKVSSVWSLDANKRISIGGADIAFPAVSSSGLNQWDQSAMISFNHSSNSTFSGVKCTYIDNFMVQSAVVNVKTGLGAVDDVYNEPAQGYDKHRWGDYSGLWRDNAIAHPNFIGFGMYGETNNSWSNWLYRIASGQFPVATSEVASNTSIQVFPNPVQDRCNIIFDASSIEKITVQLVDIQGKIVKNIMEGYTAIGKNNFSFNKNGIASGIYFIQINTETIRLVQEKITIEHGK